MSANERLEKQSLLHEERADSLDRLLGIVQRQNERLIEALGQACDMCEEYASEYPRGDEWISTQVMRKNRKELLGS